MKYILLGTYKTKPENRGWYINRSQYSILWEKINSKFNTEYTFKDCNYDGFFGRIGSINNFLFYDIKTFDPSLEGETDDKFVFEVKKDDFKAGLQKLIEEIKSNPKINYRIGLQGNNVTGLFLNYLHDPKRLDKVKLQTLSRDFKIPFGKITNVSCPNNIQLFKIYNLTQQRKKGDWKVNFHKTWEEFLT
jgi:hypothetical protein